MGESAERSEGARSSIWSSGSYFTVYRSDWLTSNSAGPTLTLAASSTVVSRCLRSTSARKTVADSGSSSRKTSGSACPGGSSIVDGKTSRNPAIEVLDAGRQHQSAAGNDHDRGCGLGVGQRPRQPTWRSIWPTAGPRRRSSTTWARPCRRCCRRRADDTSDSSPGGSAARHRSRSTPRSGSRPTGERLQRT